MLNYSIKLSTVSGGYVLLEDKRICIGSYLEILCHCPLYRVAMVLDKYREEEVPKLEDYMKKTGLVREVAA